MYRKNQFDDEKKDKMRSLRVSPSVDNMIRKYSEKYKYSFSCLVTLIIIEFLDDKEEKVDKNFKRLIKKMVG